MTIGKCPISMGHTVRIPHISQYQKNHRKQNRSACIGISLDFQKRVYDKKRNINDNQYLKIAH